MSLLDRVHKQILTCTSCPLHAGRTNAVPGEGNPDAVIFFVGEGPGADEDAQGRPFVGRSGQLLTQMLGQIGFSRSDVFIGNIVKCRPPGNRDPSPAEAEECFHYLQAQIALIRPKVIVILGSVSLVAMLGPKYTIGKVAGNFITHKGQLFFATYHPSYILRSQSQKGKYLSHFKKLRSAYDRDFVFDSE